MEPFDFSLPVSNFKDTSVAGQYLKVQNNLDFLKKSSRTSNEISYRFPMGENWTVLESYDNYTYDLIKFGGDSYDYSNGALSLNPNKATNEVGYLSRVPSISIARGAKFMKGDTVQVCFYDRSRQKPYIRTIVKRGSIVVKDSTPPITPPGVITNIWPQAAASIRKDWVGLSKLDFSSPTITIPTSTNWPILFEVQGSERFNKSDFMWPELLVLEEKYTDLPEDSSTVNNLNTLISIAHKRNGFNIESYLYAYKLTDRADEFGTPRELITDLLNQDDVGVSFPIQLWTLPYGATGGDQLPPQISNAYSRTYNKTLYNGNGYDKVHFTVIAPTAINEEGLAPAVNGGTGVGFEETFIFPLDGAEHFAFLQYSLAGLSSLASNSDSEDFYDYFDDYEIIGENNDIFRVLTKNILNDEDEPLQGHAIINYVYISQGTAEITPIFEVNLDRRTGHIMTNASQVPSIRVNAQYKDDTEPFHWIWPGFMGAAHISVAMNSMCQGHIAGEKVIFSRIKSDTDWMTWESVQAPTWNTFITELSGDTPQHKPAWHFFDQPPTINNSPSKIKDANLWTRFSEDEDHTEIPPDTEVLEDAFILPYYSLYGEKFDERPDNYDGTYRSILWIVKAMLDNAGSFSHSKVKLLERTNPLDSDILRLESLDSPTVAYLQGRYEDTYDMTIGQPIVTEYTYNYDCPVVVDCEYRSDGNFPPNFSWQPNISGCTSPCFGPLLCPGVAPESCGCFCFDYEHHSITYGSSSVLFLWGGFIEGNTRVTDAFGNVYPDQSIADLEKSGINNVLIPLPLSKPNLSTGVTIDKCSWTAKSFANDGEYGKEAIDPQVAVSETDGMMYMVIIEAKFCYLPTASYFVIDTSQLIPDPGPPPDYPEEGDLLCSQYWDGYLLTSIVDSCSACQEGPYYQDEEGVTHGGYFKTGPFDAGVEVRFPNNLTPGDTYNQYTAYATRDIKELRETKLVISNKAGTSVLTVPVCSKFSGAKIYTSAGEFIIEEELPCPENCWQLGLWKDFIILLIDSRDEFKHSPRPTIQIHNRFNGSKVAEYFGLIPDEIYEDRIADDAENNPSATKWHMWGRRVGEHHPGPRFKLAYHPDEESINGDENKPLYIHVSDEIYTNPTDTFSSFEIKSRVEYRILKFDGSVLTEVKTAFEENSQTFSSFTNYDREVIFPETYPRPGALASMALTKEEAFLPSIKRESGNIKWKIISHQVPTP